MVRLSKKTQQDLNDLPLGWSSRAELINHLIEGQNDDAVVREIRQNLSKIFVGTSWQLSSFGCAVISGLYKTYVSNNDNNARMTGRILMSLGGIIRGPWYVYNRSIFVWDQNTHFELSMFDGDLHRFVEFHSPK